MPEQQNGETGGAVLARPATAFGHQPFRGTFHLRLEANGRLALPAALRHAFAGQAVIRPYRRQFLNLWTPTGFEAVDAAVRASRPVDPRTRRRFHISAQDVSVDKQFRIVLPPDLREEVGLGEDLVLAGARETIEIWPADRFEAEAAEEDADLFLDGFDGL